MQKLSEIDTGKRNQKLNFLLTHEGYLKWTPLRIASESAPVEVISKLIALEKELENSAVVMEDINSMIPLHHAAVNQNYDAIPLLLASHPNHGGVRQEDYWHRTPLHCLLIRYDNHLPTRMQQQENDRRISMIDTLRLLLEYDSEHCGDSSVLRPTCRAVEICDNTHRVPLHIACGNRLPVESIRLIFRTYKVASSVVDSNGMNPRMYLDEWINEEIQNDSLLLEDLKELQYEMKEFMRK